jgi:hypothetical protein
VQNQGVVEVKPERDPRRVALDVLGRGRLELAAQSVDAPAFASVGQPTGLVEEVLREGKRLKLERRRVRIEKSRPGRQRTAVMIA